MPYAYYKPIESVWRGMFDYCGVYPGIYTSPAMWKLIFSACPLALQKEFASKAKLWVAQYGVTIPDKIGQWPAYHFWQYEAEPDYSVFPGPESDFADWYDLPAGGNAGNGETSDTPAAGNAGSSEPAGVDRIAILDEAIKAIEALK